MIIYNFQYLSIDNPVVCDKKGWEHFLSVSVPETVSISFFTMTNSEIEVMFSLSDNHALHECVKIISQGCGKLFTSSDPGGTQLGSGGGI